MARHRRTKITTRSSRGLFIRGFGALFGVLLGSAVVLATVLPSAFATSQAYTFPQSLMVVPASSFTFAWPSTGSGAVAIPAVGMEAVSSQQPVASIASLTKLMTATIVLHDLPLDIGQSGPCLTVTPADVAAYEFDVKADQSVIKVAAGEQLCEIDLLNGLFVHSANNYAELLVRLVGSDDASFVSAMNAEAHSLAMNHTTYADVSGIDNNSVSTAADQMKVVLPLMQSELIRMIVRQTSVVLPVAGEVHTYTPMLGTEGVVGIKSGRTDAAGGCDAMALETQVSGGVVTTYSVVLGQRGPNLLKAAGDAAFALATSAANGVVSRAWGARTVIGVIGWRGAKTQALTRTDIRWLWWREAPPVRVAWRHFDSHISSGAQVGYLGYWECAAGCTVVPLGTLVAEHAVDRPPWWEGLR